MINSVQQIPCPVCKKNIHFDTTQLLLGIQFTCSSCFASIGLASESKAEVTEAWTKFEQLKNGQQPTN